MIYCCTCEHDVEARLTNGREVYPHRPDLYALPFWMCDTCRNYVGCHHKTSNPTAPLGNIPSPALREIRKQIHAIADPLWKSGMITRRGLYGMLSDELGWGYHTAKIRTEDEGRRVLALVESIRDSLNRATAHAPEVGA